MTRTADNYFSLSSPDGQAFEMPARIAVRSVFNDTVYDTVALSRPAGRVKGSVQFPYRPEVPRVPGQARFDGPGVLPPTLGGSVSGAPQGSGGGVAPASAPASAPFTEPPPTEAPPGTKTPDVAPAPAPATPQVTTTPPPVAAAPGPSPSSSPVLWPFGKLSWPKGWGSKQASAESDKGGSPSSSSLSFFARNFWPGPAGPGYNAASISPSEASAESDNSGSANPDACVVAVETSNQCGGRGGWCRGPQCADAVWSGACCLQPGARCVRYDAQYWECRMNPFPSERADGEL